MPSSAVRRGLTARLVDVGVGRHPLTRLEVFLATSLLLALAFAVFGSHIVNGGFVMVDWSNAAKSCYQASCCGPGVTGSQPGSSATCATCAATGRPATTSG